MGKASLSEHDVRAVQINKQLTVPLALGGLPFVTKLQRAAASRLYSYSYSDMSHLSFQRTPFLTFCFPRFSHIDTHVGQSTSGRERVSRVRGEKRRDSRGRL